MAIKFSKFFIINAFLATTFVAGANAQEAFVEHDLEGFDKIRLDEVGIELDVNVGEDFEIIAEGDEELLEHLMFRVRGDKLVIYKDGGKKVWDHSGNDSPKVTVNMPSFTGLDLKGAVDAEIKGVDSDEVEFDLKGAGNIEVEGTCNWLIIDLKGAGNVEADELICKKVDVDLKGAGNIEVFASEEVDAEIRGMGNIDVYGNPENVTKSDGWFSNISIH
ncbi:head GIN domain-containing protein [Pseudemcibacter aquimaris]|uniref:head GIN domain-containing protein n=1 Tax=Pseudemcibacter aquimaris TaxID=2857064 RepID=UPI0020120FAF|nr:head GIN domain-containing protein [Pseudemcibacter aquimaris]MCC3861353.1 DUF2807 domain-containing protein [Pseudemcibacter aquimaris]WDU58125.1 DUF2807 domain-containing protein [Pseudemcibacter aquimaris]